MKYLNYDGLKSVLKKIKDWLYTDDIDMVGTESSTSTDTFCGYINKALDDDNKLTSYSYITITFPDSVKDGDYVLFTPTTQIYQPTIKFAAMPDDITAVDFDIKASDLSSSLYMVSPVPSTIPDNDGTLVYPKDLSPRLKYTGTTDKTGDVTWVVTVKRKYYPPITLSNRISAKFKSTAS